MKTAFVLLTIFIFSSCAIFKPNCPPGPVTEKHIQRHDSKPFKAKVPVKQWMKQRSDGYWLVYTTRGFKPTTTTLFECKPDSTQLEKLKDGRPVINTL